MVVSKEAELAVNGMRAVKQSKTCSKQEMVLYWLEIAYRSVSEDCEVLGNHADLMRRVGTRKGLGGGESAHKAYLIGLDNAQKINFEKRDYLGEEVERVKLLLNSYVKNGEVA